MTSPLAAIEHFSPRTKASPAGGFVMLCATNMSATCARGLRSTPKGADAGGPSGLCWGCSRSSRCSQLPQLVPWRTPLSGSRFPLRSPFARVGLAHLRTSLAG
jgi:hypothetical protein